MHMEINIRAHLKLWVFLKKLTVKDKIIIINSLLKSNHNYWLSLQKKVNIFNKLMKINYRKTMICWENIKMTLKKFKYS